MSDQVSQVKIELRAEDHASAIVRKVRGEIDKTLASLKALAQFKLPDNLSLKVDSSEALAAVKAFDRATAAARRFGEVQARASRQRRADTRADAGERQDIDRRDVAALQRKLVFKERMARQREAQEAAAERQRRTIEAATMRDFRDRLAFSLRMGRQRAAETRDAERAEAAANRSRVAGERQFRREQERTHREAATWASRAFSRGRDTVREAIRPPAAVAAAGTAGAVAGARRVLRAEGDVDAAEINTRSYGALSADAARSLRDYWAAPLAETLGAQTDKLLTAWTDAVKLGIPAAGAKSFAELATKTASAWEVPFETVTDTFGTINTLLTGKGAPFDPDRLKSVANTLQHLAAKQSTTPEKMISFLQRGAGAADVLGMSQEQGLAFGSASTSLGNQAGQSGRLFDYVASRLIEMPRLTRGHGDQAKQARELVNALGYGSAQAMDTARRRDPDAFLPDFMNRFSRIKDKKKQDQAIRFFTGREWLGEFGRMVKGIDTYKEAVKLAKESKGLDAIGAVWDLHRTKLSFVFKQFRAGWLNILGEFGKVLSPMARQAGDYWLEWTSKLRGGGLQARFKAALDGLVEGLGFRTFPDLLKGVFGQPGEGTAGTIEAWRTFARGFGQGLRDVADTIKGLFRAFTGSDGTPETIGRWTARILAFSAALVIASPVIGVLGALGTAILAFTATARAAVAAWRALGLAGTAGTAAGGAASGAAAGGFLGWLRGAFRLAPAFAAPLTMDPSKADNDRLMRRLGEWARGQQKTETDPPARVERQSAAEDFRGHLVPAAFSQDSRIAASVERLERAIGSDRARVQLASLSGSTVSAIGRASAIGGSDGGGASGGGAGFGPSGLPKAPGMNVPGWYGKGRGDSGSAGTGGSRSWRNNNPGNLKAGPFATRMGATGQDAGGFATFPDYATGRKAQESLLFESESYKGLSIADAIKRYAPGSDGNDPAGYAAQMARAAGVGVGTRMGDLTPDQRKRFLDAQQAREGWQVGSGSAVAGKAGAAGGAVDTMSRFLGANEYRDRGTLSRFVGHDVAGSVNAWCARMVNASLASVGIKGTGSAVANSFQRWGVGVDPKDVAKGDVLLESRGRGAGETGGHVGMATGETRIRNGQLEVERIAGNEGDGVKKTWVAASKLMVRRAAEAARVGPVDAATVASDAARKAVTVADKAREAVDGFRSTGWKPVVRNAFGGIDPLKGQPAAETVKNAFGGISDLGAMNEFSGQTGANEFKPVGRKTVPLPPLRPSAAALAGAAGRGPGAGELARTIPLPPQRPSDLGGQGGGGGGGGTTVHAPVTIHAGNQSPADIAGHLQRHVSEARGFRSHDLEPELT